MTHTVLFLSSKLEENEMNNCINLIRKKASQNDAIKRHSDRMTTLAIVVAPSRIYSDWLRVILSKTNRFERLTLMRTTTAPSFTWSNINKRVCGPVERAKPVNEAAVGLVTSVPSARMAMSRSAFTRGRATWSSLTCHWLWNLIRWSLKPAMSRPIRASGDTR